MAHSEPIPPPASSTHDTSKGPDHERIPTASAEEREAIGRDAAALELFVYPQNRTFPLATVCLLATSGGLTAAAALYWHFGVCRSRPSEDLCPSVRRLTNAIDMCSATSTDVANGEVHRLLLASLLRAGEQPARTIADASVLLCCGTLFERLHGPTAVTAFVVGMTVCSNLLGLVANRYMLESTPKAEATSNTGLSSTAGGIVALGAWCSMRHGRWAALPGLPLPISWLMAPILMADLSAASGYFSQLAVYRAAVASAGQAGDEKDAGSQESQINIVDNPQGGIQVRLRGLEKAVSLAACRAICEQTRAQCQPQPEDILALQDELEATAEAHPPQAPDGAFWADASGALVAIMLAMAARRGYLPFASFRP